MAWHTQVPLRNYARYRPVCPSSIRETGKIDDRPAHEFSDRRFWSWERQSSCPDLRRRGIFAILKKRLPKGVLSCKDSCNTLQRLIALQSGLK